MVLEACQGSPETDYRSGKQKALKSKNRKDGVPSTCGVMFLSGVTLFPSEKLPLRIFEPRYREMLNQALIGSRMFAVASEYDETDQPVVGLGLIKSSQEQPDGTSLLLLEGVGRIRLLKGIEAGYILIMPSNRFIPSLIYLKLMR